MTTKEEIEFLRDHKDVASLRSDTASSRGGARMLRAPRHLRADESAGALGRPSRWDLARHRAGHHRTSRSDHAPHTLEEKAKPYPASPSGMTGVQTLVPIMLDHVNAGRLSLARFVDLTSAGPARLFQHRLHGRIAAGSTRTSPWSISSAAPHHQQMGGLPRRRTPYDGVRVTGCDRSAHSYAAGA